MTRETAVRLGKAVTDGRCIFTGMSGADGMHMFPAGDFEALADVSANIFAGVRGCHSVRDEPCFDWKQINGVNVVRPVSERRWMIENMICEEMEEYRPAIKFKLRLLRVACWVELIEFPEAVQPTDLYELRLRGRE